jgi:hypothetical protein
MNNKFELPSKVGLCKGIYDPDVINVKHYLMVSLRYDAYCLV